MKKETGILFAGTIGLMIGLGIYGIRRFLNKKQKDYQDYYSDFHHHFEKKHQEDGNYGVEYLAMQ